MERDPRGIPLAADISLFGVLYNSGDIIVEGEAAHYGSLIAGRGMTQRTAGSATPVVYFDERLNTGTWPPPEMEIPRTYVTFWQTSE
jgi:hypothetical protein